MIDNSDGLPPFGAYQVPEPEQIWLEADSLVWCEVERETGDPRLRTVKPARGMLDGFLALAAVGEDAFPRTVQAYARE